ncbi:MAG: tyrosine-type recombinase/integrase [Desulfobacterales bacterium]|nr:tyrosine-type recombinase/integrase [Desulfobacterales bacterium]
MKRHKTTYPGIFYREAERIGGKGIEKVYYIVFKRDGKVYEEKVGRQFKDDMTPARASLIRAERIEGRRQSRKEIREAAVVTKWTVARLWQEYISDKPDSKGFMTDRYRYQKFLQSPFGGKEPMAIAQIDTHRLRITLAKTLAPKTVKNVLELLERVINFGVKKGLSPGLGFKIEMPKVNNIKTEDLSPEQLSKLLEAIAAAHDIQAANLMRMVLVTGMRRGEFFKLQWQHIDFEKGFIHIIGPKGGKDQTIPMNQAARNVLENHPRTDSPFVFPGRGGNQRTDMRLPINRIRKAAELPKDFRPLHGLRHTYASMLASSGEVDLYTLQKLLTHKTPAMTMRYAHLRDDTLRRASDLAGDLIGQAMNGHSLHAVNMKKNK